MSLHIALPSSPLTGFVKQYWAMEGCIPTGERHIQRIIPSGLPELTFYFGDKPQTLDESRHPAVHAQLTGHLNNYYDIVVTGKLSLFSVSFQPYGASLFFRIPASEVCNLSVPLNFLMNSSGTELEHRLQEQDSFNGRIKVMEQFLLDRLKTGTRAWETHRMLHTIALINKSKATISIDALASAACLSRKQFERSFTACIGSSPKQFLRTIRFQYSLFQKQQSGDISLTELAYRSGYYDQSHMISDYKSFSGKTPGGYFAECEPYSDYFTSNRN